MAQRLQLTGPLAQRMADVFTRKAELLHYPDSGDLRGLILTVITDTDLVLSGAVSLDDFEPPQ